MTFNELQYGVPFKFVGEETNTLKNVDYDAIHIKLHNPCYGPKDGFYNTNTFVFRLLPNKVMSTQTVLVNSSSPQKDSL